MMRRILVVHDQPHLARQLGEPSSPHAFETTWADSGAAAMEQLRAQVFHAVVADARLRDMAGLDLLAAVRRERHPVGFLLIGPSEDHQAAVVAMKAGADDYLADADPGGRLPFLIQRVLDRRALMDELEQLRHQLHAEHGFQDLVSKSPRMRRVFDLIERVGPLGSTVLLHGETGTGKDLVARAIHRSSGRAGAFLPVNCAAIQDTLLESELFGHERGAFTGADRLRRGRFELADGGTLFLDEVAEISPVMQSKLLRVLQTGQFERVGGEETLTTNVRIVAASNRRLEDEVAAGRFRSDLFYRLAVIRIDLPSLRDRREDIPLLAVHFLEKLRLKSTPPVTEIHPEAMQALIDYNWPGNVRELENAIRAAVAMADGTIVLRDGLPATIVPKTARRAPGKPLVDVDRPMPEVTGDLVARVEREYFGQLLAMYRGNIASCARHSGLSRRCATLKLQKYALDSEEFRLSPREERSARP
jgi:DNA-binding NtrC family response regulator